MSLSGPSSLEESFSSGSVVVVVGCLGTSSSLGKVK